LTVTLCQVILVLRYLFLHKFILTQNRESANPFGLTDSLFFT